MEKIYSDLVLFFNNYRNIGLLGYWGFNFSPLLEKIYFDLVILEMLIIYILFL